MSTPQECRRKTHRFGFPKGETWCVDFIYPEPGGFDCNMELRDLSSGGISFRLSHELLGLEFGRTIKYATLNLNGRKVHGDLLVMHLTPDNQEGASCGMLFYPSTDHDTVKWRESLADLEKRLNAA